MEGQATGIDQSYKYSKNNIRKRTEQKYKVRGMKSLNQIVESLKVRAEQQCDQEQAQRPLGNSSGGPVSGLQTAPGTDHMIWQGVLEWVGPDFTRHIPCRISADSKDDELELKADFRLHKLKMRLIPKQLIGNIGGAYLKNPKFVLFHPTACEALEDLTEIMSTGFSGWVELTSVPSPTACDIKVLILAYRTGEGYLGFIPNDQAAIAAYYRKVIQHHKTTQAVIRQEQQYIKNGVPVERRSNNYKSSGLQIAAMSGQSVHSVHELFGQQEKLARSIFATGNFIKNMSISVYERQLEKLNLNWDKFNSNDHLILRDATETEKNHRYFKDNIYKGTEKKYYSLLKILKPTEQQPDVTSGVNVSQKKSHVSEMNFTGIGNNQGTDNGQNKADKQNSVADMTKIPPVQPGQKSVTKPAIDSPICPSVQTPKSEDDGTRAKKRSSDNIITANVTKKRNSSEIKQSCQLLDSTPVVSNRTKITIEDVKTSLRLLEQLQKQDVSQKKSHVSETNRTGTDGNEGTDNRENEAKKQNSVVDTTKIHPVQPRQKSHSSEPQDVKRPEVSGGSSAEPGSRRAEKLYRRHAVELKKAMQEVKADKARLEEAIETLERERIIIDQQLALVQKRRLKYKRQGKKFDVKNIKQTSKRQDEKRQIVAGGSSADTHLESAEKICLQEEEILKQDKQRVKANKAKLKKATRTAEKKEIYIRQHLELAGEQGNLYKRQGKKFHVKDIKVKYQRRSKCHSRKT